MTTANQSINPTGNIVGNLPARLSARRVISVVPGTPAARRERGELLRQRQFFRPPQAAFRTIAGALSSLRTATGLPS